MSNVGVALNAGRPYDTDGVAVYAISSLFCAWKDALFCFLLALTFVPSSLGKRERFLCQVSPGIKLMVEQFLLARNRRMTPRGARQAWLRPQVS